MNVFEDNISLCTHPCEEYIKETNNRLRVSTEVIVEIDIAYKDDISVIQVIRYVHGKKRIIKQLVGKEAELLYDQLMPIKYTICDSLKEDATCV